MGFSLYDLSACSSLVRRWLRVGETHLCVCVRVCAIMRWSCCKLVTGLLFATAAAKAPPSRLRRLSRASGAGCGCALVTVTVMVKLPNSPARARAVGSWCRWCGWCAYSALLRVLRMLRMLRVLRVLRVLRYLIASISFGVREARSGLQQPPQSGTTFRPS